MKNIFCIFLILCTTFIFAMSMKPPIDYSNSVIRSEDNDYIYIKVKIKHNFSAYKLSYIEFEDIILENSKLSSITLYRDNELLCFDLPKELLDKMDHDTCWVYLYNNRTKRYECYKEE